MKYTVEDIANGLEDGTWVCSADLEDGDMKALEEHFPEVLEYTLRTVLEMDSKGTVCICRKKGEPAIYELKKSHYDKLTALKSKKNKHRRRRRRVKVNGQG